MLEAREISFSYAGSRQPVLEHLSFSLREGERLGISAPSGRGKTTLCRLLAGYERPQAGEVLLDGRPLSSYKGYCPVQMIWQHPETAVNPRLPMGEVLKEGGGVSENLMERLGIEPDWCSRFPGELSGGELQRFCIARALGQQTRFLLADEITTMLDLITQSQIWNFLLEEVEKRQIGLLVVSHDQALLDRVCERQITLPMIEKAG